MRGKFLWMSMPSGSRPNLCNASTIALALVAISSSLSVASSDCNRARSKIEYFPASIDPPRKTSIGLNSRNSAIRNATTARCIAPNSTSSENTNEKSLSTAGYFANGLYKILRNPRACNCSRSSSARKTSWRNLWASLHRFSDLSELGHCYSIDQGPR